MSNFQHPDAFKMVHYRAEDDLDAIEAVWNSRDGVVPRRIGLPDGRIARRALRHQDFVDPDFRPQVGTRVFIDLTVERAEQIAEEQASVVLTSDDALQAETAEAIVLGGMMREADLGAADITTVTIELARERGWLDEGHPLAVLHALDLRDPFGYPLADEKLQQLVDWVQAQDSGQQLEELANEFVLARLLNNDSVPLIASDPYMPDDDARAARILSVVRAALA